MTEESSANTEGDDSQIQLKTEWKRKGDRVNFFTKEAANSDFFDLVSNSLPSIFIKYIERQ